MKKYDYIIIGAGCAGLSLLMRLMDDPGFSAKKILLIDKERKESNDRTWCFWERGKGYFENILYKTWSDVVIKNGSENVSLAMDGYAYKMIRGIDFYEYCFKRLSTAGNIDYKVEQVVGIRKGNGKIFITTSGGGFETQADFVFNSVFTQPGINKNKHYLLQHFKGWIVTTRAGIFNPSQALLMDFNVDQKNYPVAFAYVLPVSATQALVEYTVFSEDILTPDAYDSELKKYTEQKLGILEYSVDHTEFGVIPMTNHQFPLYKDGICHIGAAGGQTKPSTGYTFQFIQKQAAHLASVLVRGENIKPGNALISSRFHLYDSILLNVLSRKKMKGSDVFTRLFQRVPASLVFKFLDNETSFPEEMKILKAMPAGIFLPAALKEIFHF